MADQGREPRMGLPSEYDKILSDLSAEDRQLLADLRDDKPRDPIHLSSTRPPSGSFFSPYIAFKRFVDDNVGTLSRGFQHLPSNLAELGSRSMEAEEHEARAERDSWHHWYGTPAFHEPDGMPTLNPAERDLIDAQSKWLHHVQMRTSALINYDVPLDRITALFQDTDADRRESVEELAESMLSYGGAFYYLPETGDRLPVTQGWNAAAEPSHRWLDVDWFRRSSYSPIVLQAHPTLGAESAKWRAAFEDLVSSTLDKPMSSSTIRERFPAIDTVPGNQWLRLLQGAGLLPPVLPQFYAAPEARVAFPIRLVAQQLRSEDVTSSELDSPLLRDVFRLWMDDRVAEAVVGEQSSQFEAARFAETGKGHYLSLGIGFPPLSAVPELQRMLRDMAERNEQDQDPRLTLAPIRAECAPLQQAHCNRWSATPPAPAPAPAAPVTSLPPPPQHPTDPASALLAELTTTETVRLSDGSVTTKVVLKKRFADGSERIVESQHTSHGEHHPTRLPHDAAQPPPPPKPSRGKGWFWT